MLRMIKILLISIILIQINAQDFRDGKRFLALKKYSDAIEYFKRILLEDDGNSSLYYYLGKSYMYMNEFELAEKNFYEGISKDKENPINFVGLLCLKLIKNDSSAIDNLTERIIDLSENNSKPYSELAEVLLIVGVSKWNEGINFLTSRENNFKKDDEFYLNLGNLYLSLNKASEARECYQNAVNINGNRVEAYLGLGDIYMRIKAYKEAEEYFNKVLEVDSGFIPAYKYLLDFFSETKQYSKAVEWFEKYLEQSEFENSKLEKYAVLLFLDKKYKNAIEVIRQQKKDCKLPSQTIHILSFCYYYLDNSEEGIPAFLEYSRHPDSKPFSATDYEYLGKLYEKSGSDSMAIDCFLNAIRNDSTKTALQGDIALIYIKKRSWDKAIEHFKIKENSNLVKLNLRELFEYGRALMLTKDFYRADTLFSDIILSYPELPLAYLMKARALSSIDTTSEEGLAKPYYENFIELAESSKDSSKYKNDLIEAHSYLGYFYFLKKDSEEFESEWKEGYRNNWNKVLYLDPTNEQAQEAIKNIPKFRI